MSRLAFFQRACIDAMDLLHGGKILGEPAKKSQPKKVTSSGLQELLKSAISSAAQEDGWASLSVVGSLVNKNDPSFDPRNFGYKKLGDLVRDQVYLKVDERQGGSGSSGVHIYVRVKEA